MRIWGDVGRPLLMTGAFPGISPRTGYAKTVRCLALPRQNRDLSLAHASFRFQWVLRGPLAV